MAVIIGKESAYLRSLFDSGIKRLLWWLALVAAAGFIGFAVHLLPRNNFLLFFLGVGVILAAFCLAVIFISRRLDTESIGPTNAFHGLRGEADILRLLRKLPETYTVYRGLRFRDHADVDFLVVGPAGIFALEVKSHRGIIGYDGQQLTHDTRAFTEKNVLAQAMTEAMDVHHYIHDNLQRDVFVVPVIVFSHPRVKVRFGMKQMKGVYVIRTEWLLQLIEQYKAQENVDLHALNAVLLKKAQQGGVVD